MGMSRSSYSLVKTSGDWLSLAQAARSLGISERTVRRHIGRGSLRSTTRGGARLVVRADVDALKRGHASAGVLRLLCRLLFGRLQRLMTEMSSAADALDARGDKAGAIALLICLLNPGEFEVPPGSVPPWCHALLALEPTHLDQPSVWTGLRRLSTALQQSAQPGQEFPVRMALAHLQQMAVAWLELRRGRRWTQRLVAGVGAGPNRGLVRRRRR